MIGKIEQASATRIGTGVLNRLMRAVFAANPPPMVKGRRLKLFYAAQSAGTQDRSAKGPIHRREHLQPPEFVLFVNDPRLLSQSYARYVEARIRDAEPYSGLPIILTLRPRSQKL
jgi:GTP-binding protein